MSASNATTNYAFPIFIGTDKPAWLVDWNSAMTAIDAAIKAVDTDVQGAVVDISGLSSTVASHTATLSTISGQITVITTNLNTATGNINTINSLIGNGTPTTTDQTLIGAINELHANQGDLADLTTPAVSLVAAINAISAGGAVAASAVSYDNSASGLTATNVQAAIDELAQGGGNVEADDVSYDNTASGLTATNVQNAIDEIQTASEFKLAGTVTGTSPINLSNIDFKELILYITIGTVSTIATMTIIKDVLSSTSKRFTNGSFVNGNGTIWVDVSLTSIALNSVNNEQTPVVATSELKVYYR